MLTESPAMGIRITSTSRSKHSLPTLAILSQGHIKTCGEFHLDSAKYLNA